MICSSCFPIFALMQIKSVLKRGEFHPVFCEDFLFHAPINDSIYLAAVMDGCSMGNDSHFASALIGKILNKIIRELAFREFYGETSPLESQPLAELGKYILRQIKDELRSLANRLHLEQLELLSTLNLSLLNHTTNRAWVMVIGDGVVVAGEKIIEIEQGNRPNYLAYHLAEDFDEWFVSEKNYFEFADIRRLIIASDGVLSFEKMEKARPTPRQPLESYILNDIEFEDTQHPFEKRIEKLKDQFGFIGMDDISIIRMSW